MDSGKRDRPLGKNIGIISEHAGLHAKVHLELNLARDVKDNKEHFLKYIRSKRKTWENEGPLLNEMGAVVTKDIVKTVSTLILSLLLMPILRNPPWKQEKKSGRRTTSLW